MLFLITQGRKGGVSYELTPKGLWAGNFYHNRRGNVVRDSNNHGNHHVVRLDYELGLKGCVYICRI